MTRALGIQTRTTRVVLGVIDALERRGHDVKGVRISVDGDLTVLTDLPLEALASNDADNLVGLAGKKTVSRA